MANLATMGMALALNANAAHAEEAEVPVILDQTPAVESPVLDISDEDLEVAAQASRERTPQQRYADSCERNWEVDDEILQRVALGLAQDVFGGPTRERLEGLNRLLLLLDAGADIPPDLRESLGLDEVERDDVVFALEMAEAQQKRIEQSSADALMMVQRVPFAQECDSRGLKLANGQLWTLDPVQLAAVWGARFPGATLAEFEGGHVVVDEFNCGLHFAGLVTAEGCTTEGTCFQVMVNRERFGEVQSAAQAPVFDYQADSYDLMWEADGYPMAVSLSPDPMRADGQEPVSPMCVPRATEPPAIDMYGDGR